MLLDLAQDAPDHPEVLRWLGVGHFRRGEWAAAAANLARSSAARPDDSAVLTLLGAAQECAGDYADALQSLRAAALCTKDGQSWFDLSVECDRQGHADEALAAIEGMLRVEPRSAVALLQRGRCLQILGRTEVAAADYRDLIARNQLVARAWFALLDLKTVPLAEAELALLERTANAGTHAAEDQVMLDFALGKAMEDAGRHVQAFAALTRANAGARRTHPWDGPAFSRHAEAVRAAFALNMAASPQPQGREVIFLVGLPRSSTTLVEQVLAAHSQVEGASELPYLNLVVEEESRRRARPFPAWVAAATPQDWERLGKEYLRLSARWRAQRPIATDKLPENWLLAGAALAMLPGARVIDCRRDPVETCWSCYKQLFAPSRVGFAYDFQSLAAYWRDYDRVCAFWARQFPRQFRVQQYEALVAHSEKEIRALLEFCGLPFEPGCLELHKAARAIRTPSSSQVRQPMRKVSTPAAGYGALLDPLRALISTDRDAP